VVNGDVMQATGRRRPTNRTLVDQTKTNDLNIRDVSRVTVTTDVQPPSTGARLRLANPAAVVDPVVMVIVQIW